MARAKAPPAPCLRRAAGVDSARARKGACSSAASFVAGCGDQIRRAIRELQRRKAHDDRARRTRSCRLHCATVFSANGDAYGLAGAKAGAFDDERAHVRHRQPRAHTSSRRRLPVREQRCDDDDGKRDRSAAHPGQTSPAGRSWLRPVSTPATIRALLHVCRATRGLRSGAGHFGHALPRLRLQHAGRRFVPPTGGRLS
jgi:hypothetical protein